METKIGYMINLPDFNLDTGELKGHKDIKCYEVTLKPELRTKYYNQSIKEVVYRPHNNGKLFKLVNGKIKETKSKAILTNKNFYNSHRNDVDSIVQTSITKDFMNYYYNGYVIFETKELALLAKVYYINEYAKSLKNQYLRFVENSTHVMLENKDIYMKLASDNPEYLV